MITDSSRLVWRVIGEVRLPMLPILGYVLLVSWVDLRYHLEAFDFPIAILSVLGTVIGLLLAFRTNSSYDRWWEARTLWGAIVNDSRTWVRQLSAFSKSGDDPNAYQAKLQRMALRQSAWCYALSRDLRGQDPIAGLHDLIDLVEIDGYRLSHNVPNDLLQRQAMELRELSDSHQLDPYQFVELERTLTRLTNAMGGCERINNTPFPASYGRMVHGLIYGFVMFLPFGLVHVPAPVLIFLSLSLSFGFLLIDQVAKYLQDPFSNRPSDTPTLALSRTVEINIRQMLGETELPEKIEPVDGVLR
ncbi:Bestrophin, RFP-TM, chloride channel [Planctomycetes bacterium CA13]|uniref:Bestrophin, RFP-TM, chloride channel n=1 Tax=Novipirellula herctigrandis TaxID=2527986 RepID=A0A5C5YWN7_9BACT|nr:Bestrophin, RFP-TM, chloride channel [Planctomycetes bacterium CA13]